MWSPEYPVSMKSACHVSVEVYIDDSEDSCNEFKPLLLKSLSSASEHMVSSTEAMDERKPRVVDRLRKVSNNWSQSAANLHQAVDTQYVTSQMFKNRSHYSRYIAIITLPGYMLLHCFYRCLSSNKTVSINFI